MTADSSMRIQRALARAGVASRRRAEELVAAGRVRVNGTVAETGQVVDPARDEITVDGRAVRPPAQAGAEWIVLNKPVEVMTTRRDPQGRRTVFDLVRDVPGLTYVGRLDYMTEGVLLLTTDGAAAHALTHPSGGVERTYEVTVRGAADEAAHNARRGVLLDDGPVHPTDVSATPLRDGRWLFRVTIAEGRKREVRRLCKALGLYVDRLVRVRYGPVELGPLGSGKTRGLTDREKTAMEGLLRRLGAR
ncbi:MAG TPA: pseudouridine synthase [Gemmatimonadaceae bacterium]|nr:pseudouridine synthase [Gemmatimonadaceae bacterium]